MKKSLLVAGTILASSPAWADVPTIDLTSITKAAEEAAQQLTEAKNVVQQTTNTVHQLTSTLNPNEIAQQLVSAANPLPNMGNVSSMITGGGGIGSVAGLASQFSRANTIYKPTSTGPGDFVSGLLTRQGNSWSNTQGMAAQQVQDAQARYDAIAEIQNEIPNATSQADLTALTGRLEAEKAKLSALEIQMQSTQVMANTQQQQYGLQEIQRQRESADALMVSFGGTGTGSNTPAGTPTGPTTTSGLVAANTPNVPNFVAGP